MKVEKEVLFLSGMFPKEFEDEILKNSKGNIQHAANVFQWNLIEGFDSNLSKPIKILNLSYIGSYPLRYKQLIIRTKKFSHIKGAEDINIGFINLMGIKFISRWIAIKPYLKKWAQGNSEKEKIVYAYALTSNNLRAFKYLKRLNPKIKTCIIVPDLPEYMNTNNKINIIYRVLKKIDIKKIRNYLKYSEKFVILTKAMSEKLKIDKKNFIVVEGIIDRKKIVLENKKKEERKEKIIFYSGTLNEKYGVKNLIDAFGMIENKEFRLVLCGEGDVKEYIEQRARIDKRIDYRGMLKNEEVINLQKRADVLINPRMNNEKFCKYSFPSKIMEYLATGNPVIAYKLDGIPDEYDEYLNYPDDSKIESLAIKIIEVMEKNEKNNKIIKDLLLNKTAEKQVSRILNME
ncbi:MAG: glycosyltransferase [Clostridium sp.]